MIRVLTSHGILGMAFAEAPREKSAYEQRWDALPQRASRSPDHEQKRVALGYLQEAWAEARLDGIDGDCLAQACLFAALAEFVTTYGEDAAATFAEGSAARIRNGEFSLDQQRQ